ncbi:tol-pal system-associated acyl-CoA thioesterase [Tropicimonas sp. IMCC34043]|uniref:tol-pal system-associated acyl-CoA thioesterase n=1 Tax=Tropicimonas sp. IMCC34043 TaxID=2248760 RepID=UPI000E2863BA|nr:tol-pal system-associated acyl-CoA thioesterase [Tropicimonas sp. IMCC34043]
MPHLHTLRVYYEDTDMAGIVYYANYLKFIERGRTEWVRARGLHQQALKAERGIVFAVRRVTAEYLASARLDDLLTVETALTDLRGASFVMAQKVLRGAQTLFEAEVTLVTMTAEGRAVRVPADIRALIAG